MILINALGAPMSFVALQEAYNRYKNLQSSSAATHSAAKPTASTLVILCLMHLSRYFSDNRPGEAECFSQADNLSSCAVRDLSSCAVRDSEYATPLLSAFVHFSDLLIRFH